MLADEPNGRLEWAHRVVGWVVWGWSCAAAALLVHTALNAPSLRDAAEQRMAAEIEEGSRAACRQLGAMPGTAAYPACAATLSGIRRRHEERLIGSGFGLP